MTRTNRTPYEIVTIASLVEAEARHAEDYGKVARVVYNRLEQGMPLQFDSTVNYALNADKQIVTNQDLGRRLALQHLQAHRPAARADQLPGLAALKAAVNPTPGNWLYFVTTNPKTGETKFTDQLRRSSSSTRTSSSPTSEAPRAAGRAGPCERGGGGVRAPAGGSDHDG